MSADYCRCAVPIEVQGECERCGGFVYMSGVNGPFRPELVDGVPIDRAT